jgi:hypothetical protein
MKSPGVRSELGAGTSVVLEGDGGAGGEVGVIASPLIRGGVGGCNEMGGTAGSTGALICSFVRCRFGENLSHKACARSRFASIVARRVAFHAAD